MQASIWRIYYSTRYCTNQNKVYCWLNISLISLSDITIDMMLGKPFPMKIWQSENVTVTASSTFNAFCKAISRGAFDWRSKVWKQSQLFSFRVNRQKKSETWVSAHWMKKTFQTKSDETKMIFNSSEKFSKLKIHSEIRFGLQSSCGRLSLANSFALAWRRQWKLFFKFKFDINIDDTLFPTSRSLCFHFTTK